MGCNCNKNKPTFQVVLPDGKVAFSSPSETAAKGVQKRYPGSTVRPATPNRGTTAAAPKPASGTTVAKR